MPTKPTGRPRGRPPGAKNIPKVEDFVVDSIVNPPAPPPPPQPLKVRGPWANMTPEERSEYARKLRSKQGPQGGRKPGVPRSMTVAQFEALKAEQKPLVKRIMKKMADQGQLPDDPRAQEALEESMLVLRTADSQKDKLTAARLILDFTKAKPSQKIEHTVKTAEDYLDELTDDE